VLLVGIGAAGAHEPGPEEEADESFLLFDPPAPGTYELPGIQQVGEHPLVDAEGHRVPLLGLTPDQVAIVAFIYSHCVDGHGCPLALATLQRLDRKLARRPELASRVVLVTVSFDPVRDTPDRMAQVRAGLRPKTEWKFLTGASVEQIGPALTDFGQDALSLVSSEGDETGLIRHVLKVFLVDGDRWVRNVYSAGFLDARILLHDIETVLSTHSNKARPE
jgi:cytochrome oxidase Cu insertion factor (SCO1/SenC/PrrC family)